MCFFSSNSHSIPRKNIFPLLSSSFFPPSPLSFPLWCWQVASRKYRSGAQPFIEEEGAEFLSFFSCSYFRLLSNGSRLSDVNQPVEEQARGRLFRRSASVSTYGGLMYFVTCRSRIRSSYGFWKWQWLWLCAVVLNFSFPNQSTSISLLHPSDIFDENWRTIDFNLRLWTYRRSRHASAWTKRVSCSCNFANRPSPILVSID